MGDLGAAIREKRARFGLGPATTLIRLRYRDDPPPHQTSYVQPDRATGLQHHRTSLDTTLEAGRVQSPQVSRLEGDRIQALSQLGGGRPFRTNSVQITCPSEPEDSQGPQAHRGVAQGDQQ